MKVAAGYSKKRIAVIGAGLGGLAAAIRLAAMGFKVSIYEQNQSAGGKMQELQLGSYRFDTGPSVLTLAGVLDNLFQSVGQKRTDFLHLLNISHVCRYFFPDGSFFDAFQDIEQMEASIYNLSPSEVENYKKYLVYAQDQYNQAGTIFLNTPIHEFCRFFTWKNFPLIFRLLRLDAFKSMDERNRQFFNNPKLVQIFNRYATYNGSNPYQAPATLNMISYVENVLGAYYISGGMYRLVDSLVKLCERFGVQLNYKTSVQEIVHNDGKISGIKINGKIEHSDYVVCNNDVVTSYQTLIKGFEKQCRKLASLEPSLSGLVFLWGIAQKFDQLKHHNILFSADYQKEFDTLFRELRPPDDPTIYIAITNRQDAEHAPKNRENWFVLLNMPYLSAKIDWTEELNRMREIVLNKLERFGMKVDPVIEVEKIITPLDFLNRYGSNRGSIYGLASNSRFSAFLRPPNRNRDIDRLYFVGGSTHPGGGIPLVLSSAKIVADLITEREKKYDQSKTQFLGSENL